MPSLTEIAANTATVVLKFGEALLHVEYHPLLITDEIMAKLMGWQMMQETEVLQNLRELNKIVVEIIESWDLWEKDGVTPIPLTVERIARLSPVIKIRIIAAIGEDLQRPEVLMA